MTMQETFSNPRAGSISRSPAVLRGCEKIFGLPRRLPNRDWRRCKSTKIGSCSSLHSPILALSRLASRVWEPPRYGREIFSQPLRMIPRNKIAGCLLMGLVGLTSVPTASMGDEQELYENALASAVGWLASRQNPDGSWGDETDIQGHHLACGSRDGQCGFRGPASRGVGRARRFPG
ncbi:MAG: hypothetical protein BECKG1743F_GA0114225_100113 [Candidatus Kentron sp. G]|nr:MAG: hypothetical protein BECKG1743F_GA0114225_100113 [Candidatus Kentron sp. G]